MEIEVQCEECNEVLDATVSITNTGAVRLDVSTCCDCRQKARDGGYDYGYVAGARDAKASVDDRTGGRHLGALTRATPAARDVVAPLVRSSTESDMGDFGIVRDHNGRVSHLVWRADMKAVLLVEKLEKLHRRVLRLLEADPHPSMDSLKAAQMLRGEHDDES